MMFAKLSRQTSMLTRRRNGATGKLVRFVKTNELGAKVTKQEVNKRLA